MIPELEAFAVVAGWMLAVYAVTCGVIVWTDRKYFYPNPKESS